MSSTAFSSKIKPSQLSRNSYLYIRQSTLRQVCENSESTKRQYALKDRIRALGWPDESIVVIDHDLGQSGAEAHGRSGFQELVSEVGLGKAGMIAGIEVSRLSRSSADWTRLLEICAIADTLIMDEDGIYNVNDFNDRLLLGLKGTMSEAELHYLKARMRGGLLNKAKRGELQKPLPIGYIYNDYKQIVKDPDQQVQEAINTFFKIFKRTGAAWATIREFNRQGFKFPMRIHKGFRKGELQWVQIVHSRALQTLHNPMYAGIYTYGETQTIQTINGKRSVQMPKESWHACLKNSHPAYITVEEYEENIKILKQNAHPRKEEGRNSPAREGSALLQGIVVCGICGNKMTLRYGQKNNRSYPIYTCQKNSVEFGQSPCQNLHGENIDNAINKLIIEVINPIAIDAIINVQNEMIERKDEIIKFHNQQIERAQYNVELARRRYLNVDPDNRLVANELESEWNQKLKELELVKEECKEKSQAEIKSIDDSLECKLKQLAYDFPKVWNNPETPFREKKRMLRCIIEDVTLTPKENYVTLGIRFKSGTTKIINVQKPIKRHQKIQTSKHVLEKIDCLMTNHTNKEIAEILNENGYKTGTGLKFTNLIVAHIITTYKFESRFDRFKKMGLLTMKEKMIELGISQKHLAKLRDNGQVKAYCYNRGRDYMYEPGNVEKNN
jgi:DNA invertase Pin-like site-specific DNA recombinase